MNKNGLIAILLVIFLLLIGAFGFLLLGPSQNDDMMACTEEAKVCPDGSSVGRVAPSCAFAPCPGASHVQTIASTTDEADIRWKFVDKGENEFATPRTSVQIIVANKSYDLGTYDGSCVEIADSSWALLPNEESGVICWWAGGGSELGLFREGANSVVKLGTLDEGSVETASVRGNFKDHLRL